MKKIIVGFVLVISWIFIGFICGGTIAKFFFIKAGDGLAGAATAAMMGIFGGVIGSVVAIVLLRGLTDRLKTIVATLSFLVSLMLFGIFHYQYKQRQLKKQQENVGLFGESGQAAPVTLAIKTERSTSASLHLPDGTEMGIGVVSIAPEVGKTLRFYGKPEHYQLPEHLNPTDSLIFADARHYVDIATAPPWFVPHYMKLDYGFLQLIAVTVQQNWVEVIVNSTNGQTSWVYKGDVGYSYWPEFLLKVHSVELLNPTDFPPRIKPMDHAAPIENIDVNSFFHPVSIKDEWMEVHPDHETDSKIWIRWKRNSELLVRYSLLS